jgi:hypothetical protein
LRVFLAEDEHPVRKFVERGIVEATLAGRWGIRRNLETYVRATSAKLGACSRTLI